MNNQLNIFDDFNYLKINVLTERVKEDIRTSVKSTVNIKNLDLYIKYFGWPVINLDDFNESKYARKEEIYVQLEGLPLECFIIDKIIKNEELHNFKPEDLTKIREFLCIHYKEIITNQFNGLTYLHVYANHKQYEGTACIYDEYREFLRR